MFWQHRCLSFARTERVTALSQAVCFGFVGFARDVQGRSATAVHARQRGRRSSSSPLRSNSGCSPRQKVARKTSTPHPATGPAGKYPRPFWHKALFAGPLYTFNVKISDISNDISISGLPEYSSRSFAIITALQVVMLNVLALSG